MCSILECVLYQYVFSVECVLYRMRRGRQSSLTLYMCYMYVWFYETLSSAHAHFPLTIQDFYREHILQVFYREHILQIFLQRTHYTQRTHSMDICIQNTFYKISIENTFYKISIENTFYRDFLSSHLPQSGRGWSSLQYLNKKLKKITGSPECEHVATAARERVEFSNELMLLLRLCACEGVSVFFFQGGVVFLFFVSRAGGEMVCKEMVRVGWGGGGWGVGGGAHICSHSHTHELLRCTRTSTYLYAHTRTHTHMYINTQEHTRAYTHTQEHTHTLHKHTGAHRYIYTHRSAHTQVYINARTHTHTHT